MAVEDWSTSASDNGTVGAVNIAEMCPSANLNNAIREVMAQIAAWRDSLGDDYQAKDGTLTALAALAFSANKLVYSTGADAFALADITPFALTILDDADAGAVCQTLGAVRLAAVSLGNPGYVRFTVGLAYFQIAWGSFNAIANTSTAVSYAAPFPNASFPLCSGAIAAAGSQDNLPATLSANAAGFVAYNAENSNTNTWYIAVGY